MQRKTPIFLIPLIALTIFAATSCKRNNSTLAPYVPPNSGPFTYKINGLKDTALERTGDVRYLIFVEKLTGGSESVTLSAEDLPKGMEIVYEPVNGAPASFNTTLVIKALRVKEGTHKINIRGASATTGISNNYVNVKILPYTNPATGLVGNFNETGQCVQQGSVGHNVTIVTDATIKNRIHIKGLFSGVMTNEVYADINPATMTLVIPSQQQSFVTYQGDGSYDDDKLIINYTVTGASINESCTSTLTRY